MTASQAENVASITYYPSGLTKKITFAVTGNTTEYWYDDRGNKLKTEFYDASAVKSKFTWYVNDAGGNVLAIYEYDENVVSPVFKLMKQPLYGSGRVGVLDKTSVSDVIDYEITDHLGNVRVVITDLKKWVDDGDNIPEGGELYASVASYANYYVGGSYQPSRSYSPTDYRYSFNKGSEKDDEIAGSGNHITTFFREGDTRLLLWWGDDPKPTSSLSPYSYMNGNPILYNDPMGDIVDYGKIGQGGLKNRINSGVASLFNRNYRNRLNTWKNSTDTYHLNQVDNSPDLKLGGRVVRTDATNFNVNYGGTGVGIEQKALPIFGTKPDFIEDNASGNATHTQTLKRVVPGTNVTISPLPHPDELTFNDQAGTTVFQGTFVRGNNGDTYATLPGFQPVTVLVPGVTGTMASTTFAVPAGTTKLRVTQRSTSPWPYTDAGGTSRTSRDTDSQWRVDYTKYRVSIPVIR